MNSHKNARTMLRTLLVKEEWKKQEPEQSRAERALAGMGREQLRDYLAVLEASS